MDTNLDLARMGVYSSRAARYTSYPTAVHFTPEVGADFMRSELAALPPDKPVSVYVHIPFCERLCWFCACRTQGTRTAAPVKVYLESLKKEIRLMADTLPDGIRMTKLHWGGGSPTILSPDMVKDLSAAIYQAIKPSESFEFSVEIDPTLIDQDKVDALKNSGMTRASIGIQDFAEPVQQAIGRLQSVSETEACVAMLRKAGVRSVNMDILYGLPFQTLESVAKTIGHVGKLDPDRIALYGYAHVPWMAKRQQMIDENALPDGPQRRALFELMSDQLVSQGLRAIGIDHFAKAKDTLSRAAETGGLRRNFQGYTTDRCDTLIGLGASAISKLPGGYAQNAAKSSHYMRILGDHTFATQRGIETSPRDRVRARVIEMIMCEFELRLDELRQNYNADTKELKQQIDQVVEKFPEAISANTNGFRIERYKRSLARLVASEFDDYTSEESRYSMVS
ncbi:MAG: oxygen-independent coproporphyrinogen III oxidase [Rhodobacteraceae bacterium]|nr:oxygen-independent coproporphyrinogen III oxidase [Paracoccaceae bacterium]